MTDDYTVRCSRCDERKPKAEFRIRFGAPDSWCKACHVQANREWRDANRDAINARRRERYATRKEPQR